MGDRELSLMGGGSRLSKGGDHRNLSLVCYTWYSFSVTRFIVYIVYISVFQGWFFFPVFSREKLQFLRNIACIRINSDAAGV